MRALADEKAELDFLLKAPEDESDGELKAYAADARRALDEFLALVPRP